MKLFFSASANLILGEQGTAKTVMIKSYTLQFDPDFKLSKSFNFSSETTPNMVQVRIDTFIKKVVVSLDYFLAYY